MKNVIILGSGRSGTSMLAGSLAKSGYYLGDKSNYLGKNKANPKGFFEDYEVNTINEDILKETLPINIPERLRKKFFPTFTFYRARWLLRLPKYFPVKSTVIIENRIKRIVEKEPFCLKDPRFSYTLKIWKKFFNNNTRFIVVFREPKKTAISIERECLENDALKPLNMDENRALKVWYAMYSHILKTYLESHDKKNWMFFHYNQIFDIRKVEQLESFIESKIDLNFAEKQISRTSNVHVTVVEKYNKLYNQLKQLSN